MPERPLLILPGLGEPVARPKIPRGHPNIHFPGRGRQAERLSPQFELLKQAFDQKRVQLQAEASNFVPEEVLVLETVGTVENFIRAAEKIAGMEWLTEIEIEDIRPDDDFYAMSDNGHVRHDKMLARRLFLIFSNQEALKQMLSLWNTWRTEQSIPPGFGPWANLFKQLREVRTWNVKDRLLETGILQDWKERADVGEETLPCEIELWFRKNPTQRKETGDRVLKLVSDAGGKVFTKATIEDIGFHAFLVHLPIDRINRLLEEDPPAHQDIALVQCEQIQFIRASGQMCTSLPDAAQEEDQKLIPDGKPKGAPVVALFDGLPLQTHRRLEGRLIIDDPDNFEQDYSASNRRHGTAMASLIIHDDLNANKKPLPRSLYVRPIFKPNKRDWLYNTESVSENTLVVDLLHRAVRRLFDGDGNEPPVAQEIAVINLSVGIHDRPFVHTLSPLARLLDWLAWHYRVLFVVSAGNHPKEIKFPENNHNLSVLPSEKLEIRLIRSVARNARHRRLLSPAESVNSMTVAAVHEDSSNSLQPQWIDPYSKLRLPSPINAQGMGYRRGIKPDLLASGGRIAVKLKPQTNTSKIVEFYSQIGTPGHCVASPGKTQGDRKSTLHSRGTSNAAALVSRAACLLYDVLEELRNDPGGEIIDTIPRSIWLKALIAHSADWGVASKVLKEILNGVENAAKFSEYVTRFLGYGAVDVNRVRECTAFRATAISSGKLRKDQMYTHSFPLPESLNGKSGQLRLTVTLAWFSPVNPRHRVWQKARLWFSIPNSDHLHLKRQQANVHAVRR